MVEFYKEAGAMARSRAGMPGHKGAWQDLSQTQIVSFQTRDKQWEVMLPKLLG